jgi:hypothetical protein
MRQRSVIGAGQPKDLSQLNVCRRSSAIAAARSRWCLGHFSCKFGSGGIESKTLILRWNRSEGRRVRCDHGSGGRPCLVLVAILAPPKSATALKMILHGRLLMAWRIGRFVTAALTAALTSCTFGPDFLPPDTQLPAGSYMASPGPSIHGCSNRRTRTGGRCFAIRS